MIHMSHIHWENPHATPDGASGFILRDTAAIESDKEILRWKKYNIKLVRHVHYFRSIVFQKAWAMRM